MELKTILTISVVVFYFTLLFIISQLTSRKSSDDKSFFLANRQSKWYLVAFGMIGTTLSGVTFISVPGWIGSTQFSYFQMVMGYILGYTIIATVLLPLYYKHNLTSIYKYLDFRFGIFAHKTGSFFFLLSRVIGAAFRLYLIAIVFQVFIFDAFGFPFYLSVLITLMLIWVYTFKGGIKTIVWTDSFQTLFLLLALVISVLYILGQMDWSFAEASKNIAESGYSKVFFWNWKSPNYFWKQFFSGAFIAIVMTGLDQDMMQKNLSCRNVKEAKTNMFTFTGILVVVKFIFLILGALLFIYAAKINLDIPEQTDYLFPTIAFGHFPLYASLIFILGLTAAAYSSADSALTALTTAFCIDFLNFDEDQLKDHGKKRYTIHAAFTLVLFFVILFFHSLNDKSVISNIFTAAGYTYGPLLGLFSFGLFWKRKIKDQLVPVVCVLAPVLTYFISLNSEKWFWGYKFGFELLILNGIITFFGLWIISLNKKS